MLRRGFSNLMVGLMIGAVIVALLPLFFILANLVLKGAGSLSLDFFTKMPAPAGETGGGVAARHRRHAASSSGVASLIGLPIGIAAGIYCAEYPGSRLTWVTRFVADVLNGTPSIVVGVFAWAWIVATPEALLRAGRQRRAGHADDPDGAPHHGGDDQAGAQLAPRGRAGPRLSRAGAPAWRSWCAPRCRAS